MVGNKKTIFDFILGLTLVVIGFKYVWDSKMNQVKNDCANRGGIWNIEDSACDTLVFNERLPDTLDQIYTGIISKPESTTYQYGTHVLNGYILDGNPASENNLCNYALKSSRLDLDKLIGKKVICIVKKIKGYPIDFGPEFLDVEHVEVDKPITISTKYSK